MNASGGGDTPSKALRAMVENMERAENVRSDEEMLSELQKMVDSDLDELSKRMLLRRYLDSDYASPDGKAFALKHLEARRTQADKLWFQTSEGWGEYLDELKRSVPESVGELLNVAADPEGAIRATKSFTQEEVKRFGDMGPKEYAKRVLSNTKDHLAKAKKDPEAAADFTAYLIESVLAKKAPGLKNIKEDDFIVAAKAAESLLGDVGDRDEPPLFQKIEGDMADKQIAAVGNDRKFADASRRLRAFDAKVLEHVSEPLLNKAVNSPLTKSSPTLSKLLQGNYEKTVAKRLATEALSRLNTPEEKEDDRESLRKVERRYFPERPLENL